MLHMIYFNVSTSSFTIFQVVYLRCFTMYGSNIAVDFDIMEHAVVKNHPHILETPY